MDSVWARTLLLVAVAGLAGCFGMGNGLNIGGKSCSAAADCSGGQVCAGGTCKASGEPGSRGARARRRATAPTGCTARASLGTCAMGGARLTRAAPARPTGRVQAGSALQLLPGFFGTCGMAGTKESRGAPRCTAFDGLPGRAPCGASQTCPCRLAGKGLPALRGHEVRRRRGPFRVYFEVPRPGLPPADFFRLPFPNDARVGADGALDISDFPRPGPTPLGVDLVKLYVDASKGLRRLLERSPASPSGSRRASTRDRDARTQCGVDVTPDPRRRPPRLGWVTDDGRTKYSAPTRSRSGTRTDQPLLPATRTPRSYRRASGRRAASPRRETPISTRSWATREPAEAALRARGTRTAAPRLAGDRRRRRADARGVAVFTVQDTTGHMARLARPSRGAPPPELKDLTMCARRDLAVRRRHAGARLRRRGRRLHEIHGRFSVPIYQGAPRPTRRRPTAAASSSPAGVPQRVRTEEVCFALTIPKGDDARRGLAADRLRPRHGRLDARRIRTATPASMRRRRTPVAVFSSTPSRTGRGAARRARSPDELVFNPLNPRAARDNFLQGAVDVLQALRIPAAIPAAASPTGAANRVQPGAGRLLRPLAGERVGQAGDGVDGRRAGARCSQARARTSRVAARQDEPGRTSRAGMSYLHRRAAGRGAPGHDAVPELLRPRGSGELRTRSSSPARRRASPPKHVFMSWGTGTRYTPRGTLDANARVAGAAARDAAWSRTSASRPIARPVNREPTSATARCGPRAVFQYEPAGYDGHFVARATRTRSPTGWRSCSRGWRAGRPRFLRSLRAAGADCDSCFS